MHRAFPFALGILAACAYRTEVIRKPPADFVRIQGLPPALPQGHSEYNCGPEALSAILGGMFGRKDLTVAKISRELFDPKKKGTVVLKIPGYVRDQGFDARILNNASLADLKEAVRRGIPTIVMAKLRPGLFHFYVLIGFSESERLIAFLDYPKKEGPRLVGMRYAKFRELWEGADNFTLQISRAEPSLQRAKRLEHQRRWESAKSVYDQVLRKNPEDAQAWTGLGNCLYFLKDLEGAERAYRKALELHPSDPQAQNNLAHVLWESGKDLNAALELAERSVQGWRTMLDRTQRSLREEKPGRIRRTLEEWKARTRRYLAYTLGTYGDILHRAGRHGEAARAFTESRDLFEDPAMRALRHRQAEACRKHAADATSAPPSKN